MSRSKNQHPVPHRYRRKSRRQGWTERRYRFWGKEPDWKKEEKEHND